jgi:hypothetical protein
MTVSARGRHAGDAERREDQRQRDREDEQAHGLHHRDRAHVRAGVLRERHCLRERARGRGEQRVERPPAVHELQVGHHRGGNRHHGDRERQH